MDLPDTILEACRQENPDLLKPYFVGPEDYVFQTEDSWYVPPSTPANSEKAAAIWTDEVRKATLQSFKKVCDDLKDTGIDLKNARITQAKVYSSNVFNFLADYSKAFLIGDISCELGNPPFKRFVATFDDWLVTELKQNDKAASIFWMVRKTPRGPRLLGGVYHYFNGPIDRGFVMGTTIEEYGKIGWYGLQEDYLGIARMIAQRGIPMGFFRIVQQTGVIDWAETELSYIVLEFPQSLHDDRIDSIWIEAGYVDGRIELTETGPGTLVFQGSQMLLDLDMEFKVSITLDIKKEDAEKPLNQFSSIQAKDRYNLRNFKKICDSPLKFRSPSREYISYGKKGGIIFIDEKAYSVELDGMIYKREDKE
ncbi:MAG: hypothetical protein HZA50_07925 [Planctomycetes bacterium]|nr:hypothetical protein [Planctomycetota bacterium]